MSAAHRPEAVRSMLLVAVAVVAVNVASLILDPRDREFMPLMVVDIGHAVIAAGVALVLARSRRSWSLRACDIAFAIVTAPFVVSIWLPQLYDLHGHSLVEPMLAHHFLLLGIAVSAPTWRSGGALIAVFTVHALALWRVLAHSASSPALDREPWFTLFFAVIAALLLYTRSRRRELERRLAAAEARARALSQVSGMLLALRDRANTPLQTLEIAIARLEQGGHADVGSVALMRRALERLVSIQRALAETKVRDTEIEVADLESSLRALLDDRAD